MVNILNVHETAQIAINNNVTLLGIGPMSINTVKASIELANEFNFPLLFIASRNQVDKDEFGSGYANNWNQNRFVSDVITISKDIGYKGITYICRDHGGQWQRDSEKKANICFQKATINSNESYLADIKANFDLIHIDPTKELLNNQITLPVVVDRVIDSIAYIESIRDKNHPLFYEIGTEENGGGIIQSNNFEFFISLLLEKLTRNKLPKPTFIVGQIGTLVKMTKNIGIFDYNHTISLIEICKKYSICFKAHNADYLTFSNLSLFPNIGIAGANVAPEFGVSETRSYLELGLKLNVTTFEEVIYQQLLLDDKWHKWLDKSIISTNFDNLSIRKNLIEATGHYYFSQPIVKECINDLFSVAKKNGIHHPERLVIENIKRTIKKYVDAFNLVNFNKILYDNLLDLKK